MAGAATPHETIRGWRRENGRLGIRNHVALIPADDAAEAACAAVAVEVPGIVPLRSARAYAEGSRDPHLLLRLSVGLGSNPNVAAAIVVGADSTPIADGIRRTGKPVARFGGPDPRDSEAIAESAKAARDLLRWAAALPREQAPLTDLWIACKCEQSDITTAQGACPAIGDMYDRLIPLGLHGVFGETPELLGAADAVEARAADAETAAKWVEARRARESEAEAAKRNGTWHRQPTDVNIAGGLTTLRLKAEASLRKIGETCRYADVLQVAQPPARGPGLYFMDTSSETEAIDQMVAAGFVLTALATGEPAEFGNPIAPLVQINGNRARIDALRTRIDLDVSALFEGRTTLADTGRALIGVIREACEAPTAAERLVS